MHLASLDNCLATTGCLHCSYLAASPHRGWLPPGITLPLPCSTLYLDQLRSPRQLAPGLTHPGGARNTPLVITASRPLLRSAYMLLPLSTPQAHTEHTTTQGAALHGPLQCNNKHHLSRDTTAPPLATHCCCLPRPPCPAAARRCCTPHCTYIYGCITTVVPTDNYNLT